jgi:hypothetical protein
LGSGNSKAGPVEEGVEVRAPAEEKTRVRSEGGEGSFPDLGDTVGEAVASPHQSRGQEKYCSPPEAAHERAGIPVLG